MKKIYHHYESWEDFKAGMYGLLHGKERNVMINKAINFTGNAKLYGEYMLKVIAEWPVACEQNLTDNSLNKKAWIGHAACCMAIGCPEDLTRLAWGCLSMNQQDEANEQADIAIKKWTDENKNKPVHRKMGKKGYPNGIPDEAPTKLEVMCKVPSYRAIVKAILKNDLALTSLGYSKEKCNAYMNLKRIEIDERIRRNASKT